MQTHRAGLRAGLRADLRAAVRTLDRRFVILAALWSLAALVGMGVLTAIIPTPIFVRPIAAEPFAIATWLLSAPLIGVVAATYTARLPAAALATAPLPLVTDPAADPPTGRVRRDGSTLGSLAGFGAFLAIGCPVCNKVALVLLGASGALSVWAPLQPIVAAASLTLLVVAAGWRLRLRGRREACPA